MATVVLDDRDPAIIYSGVGWNQGGNPQAEYNGTTTLGQPGADPSATLTFVGTGVTVLGTITINTVQMSSYSMDGGVPIVFTSANASGTWYSQTFFTTGAGALAPGVTHTLVMKPLQSYLWIDMITLDGAALVLSAVDGGDTATVVTNTTTSTAVESTSAPSARSTTAANNSGNQASSNTGLIIGGAVGGLAVVCILFVMIAYLRRLKKMSIDEVHPFKSTGIYSEPQMRGHMHTSQGMPSALVSPFGSSFCSQRNVEADLERTEGHFRTLGENPADAAISPRRNTRASPPPGYHFAGDMAT